MHVYLIYPRSPGADTEQWNLSWYGRLLGRRVAAAPPLGPALLAACTPPGVDLTAVDENVSEVDPDARPDLVAISTHTAAAPRAYELARLFRSGGVPVVLGGIHASMLPDEASRHADFVIAGEAEEAWPRFLRDFTKGKARPHYRGRPCPPEAIPGPRWDIFQSRHYLAHAVQANRGCLFDCDFCSTTAFTGRGLRRRSMESVVREMRRSLEQEPDKPLALADNDVLADPAWAREFADRVSGLSVNWTGYASLKAADHPDLLHRLAKSGCLSLVVGFESLNPVSLDSVNKYGNDVGRYRRAVEAVQGAGIAVVGSFVFGLDGDGPGIFERTAAFIEDNKILLLNLNVLTPYPGTRLHGRLVRQGRLLHRDWGRYDRRHACYRPKGMTPEQLEEGFYWIEEETHKRPAFAERLKHFLGNGSLRRRLHAHLSPRDMLSAAPRLLRHLSLDDMVFLADILASSDFGPRDRRLFYAMAGMNGAPAFQETLAAR